MSKESALKDLISSFSVCDDMELEEMDRLLEQEEQDRFRKQQLEKYTACGVDYKFFGVKLTDLLPSLSDEQCKMITDFIEDVRRGKQRVLWICGSKGTGKTALASAVLKELILTGQRGIFMQSNDYMDRLKAAESFSAKESVLQVKKTVLENNIAVFDEVGREFYSDYARYQYFDYINKAYASGRSYIMTAQMGKMELATYLTSAAVDRLTGHCKCIEFQGDSWRGKPGELYVL